MLAKAANPRAICFVASEHCRCHGPPAPCPVGGEGLITGLLEVRAESGGYCATQSILDTTAIDPRPRGLRRRVSASGDQARRVGLSKQRHAVRAPYRHQHENVNRLSDQRETTRSQKTQLSDYNVADISRCSAV